MNSLSEYLCLIIAVRIIMPSMFTVVSWLPVPLVQQVTGPRATTVNIGLTVTCRELLDDDVTVLPAKSDSDVIFCLQCLVKH